MSYIRPHQRLNGSYVKGHTRAVPRMKGKPVVVPKVRAGLQNATQVNTTQVNITFPDVKYTKHIKRSGWRNFLQKMVKIKVKILKSKQEYCWVSGFTGKGKIGKFDTGAEIFFELHVCPNIIVNDECFMMDTDFSKANLLESTIIFEHIFNNSFRGAKLDSARFFNKAKVSTANNPFLSEYKNSRFPLKAAMEETSFEGASMDGACFVSVTLNEVSFVGANLHDVMFKNVEFGECNFYDSNIRPEQLKIADGAWANIAYRQYDVVEASKVLGASESSIMKLIETNQIEIRDDKSHLVVSGDFNPEIHHIPQWEIQTLAGYVV